jgi:glycosyltransferase involved in cell wall biosynthesis
MLATPEFLVARPLPGLLPVEDRRGPLRVLIASLARGGAERIVLEWLEAEARRDRSVELAVLHPRRNAWRAPAGVAAIERNGESAESFVRALAQRWNDRRAAVSTHLIDDALLGLLWEQGVATIPTVHNAREGWRNDPARWNPLNVPYAIACAERVREELAAHGCTVPVTALRHVPSAHRAAGDPARRHEMRAAWNIGDETLLVAAIGAFKPQKDFARAVEILAALRATRDAALVILGGVLDRDHLRELDRFLDRVASLGLAAHVKLPGFVDPIAPWYAACDVMLSASRYEGLSMAACEALAAGLPVVALDVGGQSEIAHERLELLAADASNDAVARALGAHPVRAVLAVSPPPRAPRVWSVASAWSPCESRSVDTLFVTANLNAGGAQRSLVNLAAAIAPGHAIRVAVCGETTRSAFVDALRSVGIDPFRPAPTSDPFSLAESLLVEAQRAGARALCFWSADPRVKILVAKFASASLRLVDASPGAYAFEEMAREAAFASTVTYSVDAYYRRLDVLVLKHHADLHPPCREIRVIPNGVPLSAARSSRPPEPRFLVSGRIAPSKRLETIVEAFVHCLRRFPRAELHVVGAAEPRHARYASALVEAASGAAVRFRGSHPGLEHLAEDFTAAVVLGTHQGCPNAVLEAMAAGVPVIANASGGTGELVIDGKTGWLLPEDASASAVAEAMRECASDLSRADAMAAHARDRVEREYSMRAMAERYVECLRGPVS